jgi:hypothetical protein
VVVSATATTDRTTTARHSGSKKRKNVTDYKFQCPCDRCEGRPPIPYNTVTSHLRRLGRNVARNANNTAASESQMCRLLQLNDKVNEFKAIIKSGAWREIAVEWDSESGDQPLEGEQTATGVCVEDDPQCPVDDDFDVFYDDRTGFDEEYPEIDENVG